MSRVAKNPIVLPAGVSVVINEQKIEVSGIKGKLEMPIFTGIAVNNENGVLYIKSLSNSNNAKAMSGTTRALISNMVDGVSRGFEKKLELIGVGYRAKASENNLTLTLGYSHPVEYLMPNGVVVETPSQTEIILRSADKQLLGEVSAKIRSFRPPEPYKGKGVRYSNENVIRKEAKKK